jgi:hypothetical protein
MLAVRYLLCSNVLIAVAIAARYLYLLAVRYMYFTTAVIVSTVVHYYSSKVPVLTRVSSV